MANESTYVDKHNIEICAGNVIRSEHGTEYLVFVKEEELDCIEITSDREPIYNLRKEFWDKAEIVAN